MGYDTNRSPIVDILVAGAAFIAIVIVIFVVVTVLFNAGRGSGGQDADSVIPPSIKWVQVTAPAGFDVTCFGQVYEVLGGYVYNSTDSQVIVCIPNTYRNAE